MTLANRLVRYEDLVPCHTAFVDTYTPGSDRKENFTIIGPGVSESPDQHVHIALPHGFNIGGARQPPGCINSQHSHETAEVFIIHTGTWAFRTGADAGDGEVVLRPGDVISIPIHAFRGFENVGDEVGFMFAVLGGDNPGFVTWAPAVFEKAREHGLILLENNQLVDTTKGEAVPDGIKPMPQTTAADVARYERLDSRALANCVLVRDAVVQAPESPLSMIAGVSEAPIIGAPNPAENMPAGKMNWPHGFCLRQVTLAPGAVIPMHSRGEAEVLMVHSGRLGITVENQETELAPGDTLTVPVGAERRYAGLGQTPAVVHVVRGGDHPTPPQWRP